MIIAIEVGGVSSGVLWCGLTARDSVSFLVRI